MGCSRWRNCNAPKGGWRSPLRSAPYPEGPSIGRAFGDLRIALGHRSPVGGGTALCEGIFPDVRTAGENGSLVPPEGKPRRGRNPILEFAPRCGGRCPRPAVFSRDADDRRLFSGLSRIGHPGGSNDWQCELAYRSVPRAFCGLSNAARFCRRIPMPCPDGTFVRLIPSTGKGGYAFRRPRSAPDVVIVLRSGQRLSPRKTAFSLVNGAEFQSNAFFEVPRASCVRGTGAVCHAAS